MKWSAFILQLVVLLAISLREKKKGLRKQFLLCSLTILWAQALFPTECLQQFSFFACSYQLNLLCGIWMWMKSGSLLEQSRMGMKKHTTQKTLRETPPSWSTASGQHCSYFCYKDLSSSQQSVSLKWGRELLPLHLFTTKQCSKDATFPSCLWHFGAFGASHLCHGIKASRFIQQ